MKSRAIQPDSSQVEFDLPVTEEVQKVEIDLWRYEKEAWSDGHRRVVGVDEAGRGPLAGPVVAAAILLPEGFDPKGIKDSKVLSAKQRETAYERIVRECVAFGVGVAGPDIIDEINILNATHLAACMALSEIEDVDIALVDGLAMKGLPCAQIALVGGDSLSVSIGAASIIAKVTRDRMMVELDLVYPGYNFAKHKGYGTTEHMKALSELGPCPIHRRSFAPVAERDDDSCAQTRLV